MRQAGIEDGARLVLGVSGGSDSMALLRLCLDEAPSRGWSLAVGHVDHSLHPGSAAMATWVREQAEAAGLPFGSLRIRPERWTAGTSIESEARRLRRRGLRRLARRTGADRILLGHTLDDQAETVLLHLLRGAGLPGLGGMWPSRPPWVRPLLRIRREELRALLERRGLPWREDPTNTDPRFARNRIRSRVMPVLIAEIGSGVPAVVARSGEVLRSVRRYLRKEARRAWDQVCTWESPGGIRLEREKLASYDPAIVDEVLRRAVFRVRGTGRDMKRAHVTALAEAVRSGRPRTLSLPDGVEATVNRRTVELWHPRRVSGERDEPETG